MPQVIPAVVAAISYVGSAAAAVVAGTATLAQIATVAAVGIGAGVGGIAASKALTPEIGSQGAAVRWEANPDAPLRFAFGRVGVKGSIVDAAIYGPDRMYVSFACTVSAAGPIKRFVSFRAGDYYMTFNSAGAAVNEPYTGEMWLSTRLGAQPDTALSLPSGLKNGAAFPGWGTARKLSGSACYLVTLGENSKRSAYEGKIPGFVTVIEGLFCYDPRQDSTYPGGSGSCRLNDPDTWVWTRNPILFALKWTLGLWEGPTGKGAPQVDYQVGGIGAKPESIILSTVVEAANVADANGWTSAAWPSTDDDKAQVLDGFLKAGGARYAEIAGRIAFIHRAAPRAPVFTIRARDTAGPVEIDTASSKLNRINTVRPRYWSEAHEWEMTALPEVTATEWQIEDGQGVAVKRTRGADYTFVDQPKQARELASLEISNSREGIRGRVPLRPYMDPEPGNTFIFDEPDFALSNLKCIVLEVEDNTENDTVVVTFETETDGKYPYAYGQTPSPPPAQELDPYDPTYVTPPLPGDWTITPRPPAPGGGGLPSFDLTGVVSNDTATAIIVEYGPTATGPWKQAYQGPPTVTNIPIEGLQPGATYYVAVQYQRNQNYSDRYVYGPYTAPLLDPSPNAPTIQAINADITAAFGDIFDVSALVSQTRTDLEAADAALGSAIGSLDTRADVLETQTQSLEANKASVASLNAQVARVDGVEAVNADQALALVDLENGKVSLSEYNTLKGEVTAARDDAPSLLGQIQNLKSVDLDLQANKASVASVNALTARTSNTEADIIDLESALATETGARAQAISEVSTKLVAPSNEYANADLSNGTFGFTPIWGFGGPLPTISLVNGGEAIRFEKYGGDYDGSLTRYGIVAMDGGGVSISAGGAPPRNMWPVVSGERIGFAVEGRTRSGSAAWFLDVRWCDKNGANEVSLGGATTAFGNTSFTRIGVVNTVPGDGYVWAIMTVYLGWDGSLGVGDMELRRPAFARLAATAPSTALPAYSAPAGGRQIQRLESSVTSAQQAIVDLENGKASAADLAATRAQVDDLDAETFILQQSLTDVSNRLSTAKIDIRAAVGSTPAMVQLKDSQNGSVLAMVAQSLLLGSYDAGGTLVPVITLLGQRAQIDGAVDINVGSNAVTIRSAASGARIEMTGSRLSMYDG